MAKRLVVPEGALTEGTVELDAGLSHYLKDVLRLDRGAALHLADGAGCEAPARVVEAHKRAVTVEVGPLSRVPRAGLEVTLLQAVGKGDKMDAVVRQATELGVSRIVPVVSDRAVARLDKRVARWRTIAEDALRVCGRPYRPRIEEVTALHEALEPPRADLALVLAGHAAQPLAARLTAAPSPARYAELLVGPEGGLTPEELARAEEEGFLGAHLGPYTLRTETAGPAAVALVLFWAGALGGAAAG